LWAVALVLLGALLVASGAILYSANRKFHRVDVAVTALHHADLDTALKMDDDIRKVVAVAALALVLLCLLPILLGINSSTGRAVRVGALIATLAAVGASVSSRFWDPIALVVAGSVIAFVGGILLRPADRSG
jgi:hypothetical protein